MIRKKKVFKLFLIWCLALIFFLVFLKPETIFKGSSPVADKPYSVEAVQYGTGVLDKKIVFVHFKIDGKKVASRNLAFFESANHTMDLVWDLDVEDETWWRDKYVLLNMTYSTGSWLEPEIQTKSVGFDFGSGK